MVATLIIFFVVYILFATVHKRRDVIIWVGILLIILTGNLKPLNVLRFVNWNIILIFAGFLIITDAMVKDNVPALFAERIVAHSRGVLGSVILVSGFAGLISMFLENVATVLIVAPVAIAIAREADVSPIPYLMGITLSSNLQGTATLVGDPPSLILADYMKMTFLDFFYLDGRPGIFFAVEIGAIASLFVIYLLYRGLRGKKLKPIKVEPVKSIRSIVAFIIALVWLFLASMSHRFFGIAGGLGSFIIAIVLLITMRRDGKDILKKFDLETTFILMGIFVLIRAITDVGVVDLIAHGIEKYMGGSLFFTFTSLIVLSVFLSAFIDNVPYVTAMIPVGMKLASSFNVSPYLFPFAIVIAATVGGNITPIGAAANIVTFGIMKREGLKFGFWQFVRVGLLFTLAGVFASSVFLWFVWR